MVAVISSLAPYRKELVAVVSTFIPIACIFRAIFQFIATIIIWSPSTLPFESFMWASLGEFFVIVGGVLKYGMFKYGWGRRYIEKWIMPKYN